MKPFPPVPDVDDAPDRLFDGHLWLLEKIDGAPLRFRLQSSGLVRFGDRTQVYDDPDAVPEPYRHAVRHVRENLNREALRTAVDDVEAVVFFGEATHKQRIEYDWERIPSFLGFDVWSASESAFRPPDAVEQIFERLGLQPVNAFERELRAQDFDPGAYSIPQSAWYDGPAEGVVVRNKRGDRAKRLHPEFRETDRSVPSDTSPAELAAEYATQRRLERLANEFERSDRPVTVEALLERTLEAIVRQEHDRLYRGSDAVDVGAIRSAIVPAIQEFLDGSER